MRFEEERRGNNTIVILRGTLALGESTRALSELLLRIERDRRGATVVDLTNLKRLDSTALGILVGSLRRLRAAGREMLLVNPHERVAKLLHVTQLDSIFPVFRTLDEAFDSAAWKQGEGSSADQRGSRL